MACATRSQSTVYASSKLDSKRGGSAMRRNIPVIGKPRRGWSLAFILVAALAWSQRSQMAQIEGQDLTISASFVSKESVAPQEAIELRLSRQLKQGEGKLSLLIGATDVTSLASVKGDAIIYTPEIVPLQVGETQVVAYLVASNNEWKEIARFPLRVASTATLADLQPSPAAQPRQNGGAQSKDGTAPPSKDGTAPPSRRKWGFDKAALIPSFTLGLKSQVAEAHFPASSRPPRSTFADLSLQSSIRSEMARGIYNSQLQFDVLGASFQQEALRFSQDGNRAPQLDLSSYLMQFQAGKARLAVGHIAFGTNRHLMNGFSSRGISLTAPVTSRGDFSVTAMNGTSVVGWSNFFGLNRSQHQVVSGSFGLEFLKERPGGLRLETSLVDGRVLPISNFNQGAITDAERSRGLGFRLLANEPSQRWRLDGGYARSRFTNPADTLLFQERNIVPVREETRSARYLDVGFVLLRDLTLNENKKANLTMNYRHEHVAPLFRSVAASVQSDRAQNQLEVIAAVGDVTATVSHQRFYDNLNNIPSLLKTLSRRSNVIIGTPLGSLFGNVLQPSPWLPRVSYSFDEMHQFASTLPVGGGFELNLSAIPDQVSRNQSLTADWQWKKSRFGYRFNRSLQDNRQTGRERADLRNLTHGFSFGINPAPTLDLNFEVNAENALNKETNRVERSLRIGPVMNWRMTERLVLAVTLSGTAAGDLAGTSRNRSADVDVQWSYRFAIERSRYRKVQGNFFFRYASRYGSTFDNNFGFSNLTRLHTLNSGVSFNFF
jgi:hypothetical protein